jgi:hypothetical protein
MDVDLRNLPSGFSNVPEGGYDLRPGARYRFIFKLGWPVPRDGQFDAAVGDDGTVDCGPHWEAVTEGAKIIGFNRRAADVTADT